jgi:hypothetical protein
MSARKVISGFLLLFLVAGCAAQNPPPSDLCERSTDEFSGRTTISCDYADTTLTVLENPHPNDSRLAAVVMAQYREQGQEGVHSFRVQMMSEASIQTPEVIYAIVDGSRMTFPVYPRNSMTLPGSGSELHMNVFHVVFLPEQMEQLANADEARIRIDGRVFDLSAASTSARALLTHTD